MVSIVTVSDPRWADAQKAERQFWEHSDWQSFPPERRRSEWTRHLGSLGLGLEFRDQAVLDVGCGPTGVVYFVKARRRVGLDPLGATYEKWNGMFGDPIELVESKAETMPLADGEFDTVFCINCVDHSQQPEQIIAECARVVRHGGTFVFHVDLDSPIRKLHKALRAADRKAHPHSLTYRWMRSTLDPLFVIEQERRDEQVFVRSGARSLLNEAYWDGLAYRMTKSDRWRNHIWLRATRR
jgi:ubiquinone/menaquinone biosynthesis C-methylase UbiE